jgi:hypothetical protein
MAAVASTGACKRSDNSCLCVDAAQAVIVGVGNVEVSSCVDYNAHRQEDGCLGCRNAVSAVGPIDISRNGEDIAGIERGDWAATGATQVCLTQHIPVRVK